jgi:LmbE family N-acetylglucosaminyl deacetylase
MTLPENNPCFGLYICFGGALTDWEIQAPNAQGDWKTVCTPEDAFYHQYVQLSSLTRFRIYSKQEKTKPPLAISEIRLLGKGALPGWVQVYHKMQGKADLMVFIAHPDDEYLFMGGTLPYYAGELQKKVIAVYLVNTNSIRKSELLDGLWHCGVRDYPEMGTAKDYYQLSMRKIYSLWHESQLKIRITRLIRKYKPDVLVTHDMRGEYGHGAHMAAADISKICLLHAQESTYDPQSAKMYGTWQIQKMYLHLYRENQMHVDWQKPLSSFHGLTAIQVAGEAFKMHISQQNDRHSMQDSVQYDCSLFGLYFSAVGPDVRKNDFFENLPPR